MELLRITRQIHCKAVEKRATLIHRQYNRDWGTSYSRPPIDPYLTFPVTKSWRRHCLPWTWPHRLWQIQSILVAWTAPLCFPFPSYMLPVHSLPLSPHTHFSISTFSPFRSVLYFPMLSFLPCPYNSQNYVCKNASSSVVGLSEPGVCVHETGRLWQTL